MFSVGADETDVLIDLKGIAEEGFVSDKDLHVCPHPRDGGAADVFVCSACGASVTGGACVTCGVCFAGGTRGAFWQFSTASFRVA